MKFNEIFIETWDHYIGHHVKKFSDETSLCSDSPQELWIKGEFLQDSRDAQALLMILPLVCPSTRNYALMESLRNHIFRMASNYSFQGGWNVVKEILTTTTSLSCHETWKIILNTMSPQDFFGNFVKKLVQALRSIYWRPRYRFDSEKTTPVQRPKRKRGYDDKGSQRPVHKWLPYNAYASEDIIKPSIKEPSSFCWFGVNRN